MAERDKTEIGYCDACGRAGCPGEHGSCDQPEAAMEWWDGPVRPVLHRQPWDGLPNRDSLRLGCGHIIAVPKNWYGSVAPCGECVTPSDKLEMPDAKFKPPAEKRENYGPHPAARAHAHEVAREVGAHSDLYLTTDAAIVATHDPALSVPDRAYSGEYVIAWLRGEVRAGRADGAIVEQFCIDHTPYDEFYEGVDDR